MCPYWQTGHTLPGSAAATAGGLQSTGSCWARGSVVCPSSARHWASFSWRTRFDRVLQSLNVSFHWHIPTVSLDVISLVASSCRYYRGQTEQRAAHEFAVHVA